MDAGCVGKQRRIPVDVNNLKELAKRIKVDPEDSVVVVHSYFAVIAERFLHLWGPVNCVEIREVALPPLDVPRVLQLEQTMSLRPKETMTIGWSGSTTPPTFTSMMFSIAYAWVETRPALSASSSDNSPVPVVTRQSPLWKRD